MSAEATTFHLTYNAPSVFAPAELVIKDCASGVHLSPTSGLWIMLTKAMKEATDRNHAQQSLPQEANGKKRSIDNDGEGNHRKKISVVADGAGGKLM